MTRKIIVVVSLFLFITTAFSLAPEKHTLSNGMTVITQEDHSKDLISLCIYVDGGGRTESPDLAGLSHYFEHLIFRGGTQKQMELETRKKFLSLGEFFGYTFEDGTCYYINVPSDNFSEALWRYCDVLLNLELNPQKVETERGIVLEEFSQSYFDVPSGMAYFNLYRTAFEKHPYGQTVIGDTAVVKSADLSTFKKFYRERYSPDQFVLSAVGNFNTQTLLSEIDNNFGRFPASGINFEQGRIEPEQRGFKTVNYRMPVSQVYFNLGFHIVPFSAPEFPALEILNQALFGWPDGRLVQKLRTQQGLFTDLSGWLDRTKDPGLWVISGSLNTDKMNEAFTALFTELQNLLKSGLNANEIDGAKKLLLKSHLETEESFFRRAEALCLYQLSSNVSLFAQYPNILNDISAEDLKNTARRFLKSDNATLSLVLPEAVELPSVGVWAGILKAPEASEKEIKFAQLPPEEFILNNGVTILLKPVSTAQMASMQVLVRGGQWAEAPGKEGQANFLARMLNRGTLDIPDPEFSQLLSRKGISFSASVEPDFFKISLNCAKENFEEGLILASMAITRPGLREEDLKSVKSEIISEIKSINDQTYDLTRQEFNAILYRKNPYRVPLFGYENSVKDISASSMSDFHRKIFCGRNMVIAVCGNFQPDEVLKLLTEIYGEIKAGSYFEYQSAKEPALSQPEVKIIPKERAQVTYNLGWTAPSIRDEDFLPLILAMRMLSAKMFFRFIYEEGICYRMWTRYTENLGPGKFYFETGISPENYNFSKSEVLKELDNFLKQPITEEMLTDAKRESIQKMQLSTESVEAQAFAMAKYYLFGFGPDYLIRYPLMLKNIPAPEVKEVAQKYLNPKKYTLLVVGKVQ